MDIKNIVESFKSSRYFKISAIAAGVLVIAAAGGGYYFFVYQPQEQSKTAAATPPVAKKPPPAPVKPAAKPAGAQPLTPASGVPHTVNLPVSDAIPVAVVPMPIKTVQPVKSELAVEKHEAEKHEPEKGQVATKPEQVEKQEQVNKPVPMDKTESKSDTPGMSQQVAPQLQDAPQEHAPDEPAADATAEPALQRRGTAPKYNDIMTAVMRGDRGAAKELLDLGWWADKPSENGITPLMAAVMNRDAQMVQLLLEYGAEPSAQALSLARKNKDAATASLLEQKGAR